MAYVLMRAFEQAPRRFDFWMSVVSLGRLQRVRREIASSVPRHTRVLDVGCGPGAMAISLAARGADVIGIDTSEDMLAVGRARATDAGFTGGLVFKKLSSLEVEDAFPAASFGAVITILTLSELSDAEVDCTLAQCRQVLDDGGTLIVVDEVESANAVGRVVNRVVRYPVRFVAYLIAQAKDLKSSSIAKTVLYYAIELPLMCLTFLVVPPPSRPLRDLPRRMTDAGFRVTSQRRVGRTLAVIYAEAR